MKVRKYKRKASKKPDKLRNQKNQSRKNQQLTLQERIPPKISVECIEA